MTAKGGRLYAQATGQPRFELLAKSETEFFLRAVPAQIAFELGDNKQAVGLALHQAGQVLHGRRQP